MGSFGLRLNLESSDLDLGIGYPVDRRDALMEALTPHMQFKGERRTRYFTTRLVFAFVMDDIDIDIDLSALTEEDFAVACRMLGDIDANMTEEERIAHTWIKHLLRTAGRIDDYADWKLTTYAKYCPEFNWAPITKSV